MSARLFSVDSASQRIEHFDDGIFLLRGFANSTELMAQVRIVCASAPLRQMTVPGGKQMSVAMSNCGPLGWTSDSSGYRYSATDPRTGNSWPAMPDAFMSLATRAATAAGFRNFKPDACLINEYQSKAKLSLHQDRDECAFTQPIVSVSMGADAVFNLVACDVTTPRNHCCCKMAMCWFGVVRRACVITALAHRLLTAAPAQHSASI